MSEYLAAWLPAVEGTSTAEHPAVPTVIRLRLTRRSAACGSSRSRRHIERALRGARACRTLDVDAPRHPCRPAPCPPRCGAVGEADAQPRRPCGPTSRSVSKVKPGRLASSVFSLNTSQAIASRALATGGDKRNAQGGTRRTDVAHSRPRGARLSVEQQLIPTRGGASSDRRSRRAHGGPSRWTARRLRHFAKIVSSAPRA